MVVTPENIFPLAAADGVSACTGLHNIMAVRHDNVVMYSTGCLCHSCYISNIEDIGAGASLGVSREIMSVNISVNISNKPHLADVTNLPGKREICVHSKSAGYNELAALCHGNARFNYSLGGPLLLSCLSKYFNKQLRKLVISVKRLLIFLSKKSNFEVILSVPHHQDGMNTCRWSQERNFI